MTTAARRRVQLVAMLMLAVALALSSTLPASAATLSGIVVDAQSGMPVARARVIAAAVAFSGQRVFSLTADDGRFEVEVPAGSYVLVVTAAGYPATYFPEGNAEETRAPLSVLADQKIADLRIGLSKGGAISGRVLDWNGDPAAGVSVGLRRPGMRPVNNPAFYVGTPVTAGTDMFGRYRIYGLPAGEFVVVALPQGAPMAFGSSSAPRVKYAPAFYPGVADPEQAALVSVGAGQEATGIDLQLTLTRLVRIEGHLVATTGSPESGLMVELRSRDGSAGARSAVTTGGAFVVNDVAPGRYWLMARTYPERVAGNSARPLWAVTNVTVTGGDLSGVTLVLRPGSTVAGRVRVSADRSPGQVPLDLSTVRVVARPESGDSPIFSSSGGSSAVDGTGAFSIAGLPPGRYRLSAVPVRIGSTPLPSASTGGSVSPTIVTVSTEDVTGVVVELAGDQP